MKMYYTNRHSLAEIREVEVKRKTDNSAYCMEHGKERRQSLGPTAYRGRLFDSRADVIRNNIAETQGELRALDRAISVRSNELSTLEKMLEAEG